VHFVDGTVEKVARAALPQEPRGAGGYSRLRVNGGFLEARALMHEHYFVSLGHAGHQYRQERRKIAALFTDDLINRYKGNSWNV
jgi:hypothetical protein